MAWRLRESVVKGEIDNRDRGHVRGSIWLVGRQKPIALDLSGNCLRDLAGRVVSHRIRQRKAWIGFGMRTATFIIR